MSTLEEELDLARRDPGAYLLRFHHLSHTEKSESLKRLSPEGFQQHLDTALASARSSKRLPPRKLAVTLSWAEGEPVDVWHLSLTFEDPTRENALWLLDPVHLEESSLDVLLAWCRKHSRELKLSALEVDLRMERSAQEGPVTRVLERWEQVQRRFGPLRAIVLHLQSWPDISDRGDEYPAGANCHAVLQASEEAYFKLELGRVPRGEVAALDDWARATAQAHGARLDVIRRPSA